MSKVLTQVAHFMNSLPPVANAFAGTVSSDVHDVRDAHAIHFLITKGVGTTGTSTVTVEACDDTTPSNTTAIPFAYRVNTGTDVWGALTWATATGFVTTAGSNHQYMIEVDADMLANSGRKYCRITLVESVGSPVLAGITAILWPLRSPRAVTASQID